MDRPNIHLSCLLIAASLAMGCAMPVSSPCTEEEMTKPIKDFYELIEEMQSPGADINSVNLKMDVGMNHIPEHIENIKNTCGDEKTEAIEKIEKFVRRIQTIEDVVTTIDAGELEKAKGMIENIRCKHAIQFIIMKYGTDNDKIEKIIDIIMMMDDMKIINIMIEGLRYIIDESNAMVLKNLIPFMKEQIEANKDKVDVEEIMTAKLILKEIAKRNIPHCYKGVKALHEIDSEMAHQAIHEATFQLFTDSIYSPAFKLATEAPCVHVQAHALEAIFDKIGVLEIQNGLVAGKTLVLAKHLIENEEIKTSEKSMEILNYIIKNSSNFAKNVADGYSCQDFEEMRALVTGEDKREEHNEYLVFYNPEQPEKFYKGKFTEKPDGDMLLITIEREHGAKTFKYSILIDNDDYPDNLHLKGNIILTKKIGKEPTTAEEICAMNPKPEADICYPFNELFTWNIEEAIKNGNTMYENFVEYIKICNQA